MKNKLRVISAALLVAIITLLATGSAYAANPAANIDQCANGQFSSPVSCTGSAWQNGNLNANQAHYREGDSVPFRMLLTDIVVGNSNTLDIEYDYTKGSNHAYDYLTTYNRTETTADPCSGVSPCASPSTFPIPALTILGSAVPPVTQIAGNFTIWNGTITNVQYLSTPATAETQDAVVSVRITFTTTNANAVIAWGGHIASSLDWGAGDAAGAISGSPYHMRNLALNGSGGNQDRSIQAASVAEPATVVTQASAATITIGQSVTDLATVTGVAPVIGTVNFFVCGPSGGPTACTTGGTQVGGAVALTPGSGTSGTATSAAFTPSQLGTYCFRAEYTPGGNSPNSANNHTNTTTECFTVNIATLSIVTTQNPATANEGQTLNDSALLSGGVSPTGTITFRLYPPSDATCTGAAVYTDSVTVNGNGSYATDDGGYSSTQPGIYRWTAVYSGDANNGTATSGCAQEPVTVNSLPSSINVVKVANPTSLNEPGGTVNFSVSITNTSTYDVVTINTINDNVYGDLTDGGNSLISGSTCTVPQVLIPGANYSCSFNGEVSGNAGTTHTDTVTASGVDDDGQPVSDTDDATVEIDNVLPTVTLVKEADPTILPEPGGDFTFTLTITNTSAETVTIIGLTDSQALSNECLDLVGESLAPGASTSCTYTITHTEAGSYDNTATVTVQDDDGSQAQDSDDETVTVTNSAPTVTIDKSANPTTLPEPGGDFTFTLTITNTSSETVTITALTDTQALSAACLDLIGDSLAPGASTSCTYTVSHTDAGSYDNTASVTVIDDEGSEASDSDDETVTVTDVLPTVMLDKSVDVNSLPEPGGAFHFTLEITNTSSETVTITSLTDSNLLSAECVALVGTTIAPGASVDCEYTVSHSDAGTYPNTANVTVEDDEDNPASDSDNETVTVTDVLPTVTLVKSATPQTLPEPGGVFTFTLTITNTSLETVTMTALADSNGLSAQCLALVLNTTSLAPGQSVSCQNTNTHTNAGSYDNTASVTVIDDENNPASDSDTATVTVTDVLPTVTLDKSVNISTLAEPGGNFTFTLEITNTSVEKVTITALTDSNVLSQQCLDLIGTSLAAGATTSCQYTVTHTDAGVYPNTASVTVEDDEDNPASDSDDESVEVTDVTPTVTLVKSATPQTLPEPGGVFTFTLTITNTSVEDVTITELTDTQTLSTECSDLIGDTLAAGASVSCSYTVTHTNAGIYNNTANVTVQDDEQNEASDEDSETVTVTNAEPLVTLVKSANPTTLPEPGGDFTFTLTITNTSLETVTIVSLTDDNTLSQECLDLIGDTLVSGASTSCSYVVTHTNVGVYPNTALVTAQDDEGSIASAQDDESVEVTDVLPTVTLVKSANPTTLPEPGGNFTFTLTITNTSVETVTIIGLGDTNPLSAECNALVGTNLAAGASTSCTYVVAHDNVGSFDNTANVMVSDDEGNIANDSDDETVTVTDVDPTVSLVKEATPTTLPEPGGVFTFTLTITNTSVETVTITALTDSNALSAQCTALIGTTLAAGASTSCQYNVTHTDAGSYDNTANVTVTDDEDNEASDEDTETVTVTDETPIVTIDKSVVPGTRPEPGGVFTYTLTITNASTETVTITALSDTQSGATDFSQCAALVGTTLSAGASTSCQYTVTHTNAGSYPNTATVTVEDDDNNQASDSDDETVTVTDVLPTVTLDKSVAPNTRTEPGGDFDYTLTITNTSVETVTITALSDTYALPAGCSNLIGTSLAPGASVSCTYTMTFTNAGAYDNTASVTVVDDEQNEASDEDTATVTVTDADTDVTIVKMASPSSLPEPGGVFTFTLTITNTSAETVTITALTDTNALSQQCLDLIGTTLAAGASVSCTYTVTHTAVGSYDNTATVTVVDDDQNEATDSDDETVTVTNILPNVTIVKSANPSSLPAGGGVFTFTLTITNTSSETVTINNLVDTYALSAQCLALIGTSLNPGQSVSCTYTVTQTASGSYTNTATVTVNDDEQNNASDSDDETVVVQPPSTPAECSFGFVLTGQIITGTPRSDLIQGTPGNDIIYGLGGADEIYGNEGDDCIFGGRGLDNLYGNTGNDIIFGNEGDDYIDGGAGVDLVHGNEDDDLILGGDDPDQLYGDTGSDCIFGQNGDDYINGGDGDDAPLVGGNGSDTIFGGGGHDEIWGDGFPGDPGHPEFPVDVITNPGNDSLYGEVGHDIIVGGGGNDAIDAGQGNDQMYGEDGDDTLTGGSLSDYFDGGAGTGDTATDWDINTDDLCADVEFGCVTPAPVAPVVETPIVTPVPDSDGDGVDDTSDICAGFNDAADTDGDLTPDGCDSTPNGDSDGDGVDNTADICPTGDDAVDTDGDLTPDGCDSTPNGDSDGDGVDNTADICPTGDDAVDTDGDLTPDGCDGSDDRDPDGDTLTNTQEIGLGTNPDLGDTDGDGVNDNLDAFPLDNTQI